VVIQVGGWVGGWGGGWVGGEGTGVIRGSA
jgi:hypothetical protein